MVRVRVRFDAFGLAMYPPPRIWVLRLGSWLVYRDCFVAVQDSARSDRHYARQAARAARIAAATAAAITPPPPQLSNAYYLFFNVRTR